MISPTSLHSFASNELTGPRANELCWHLGGLARYWLREEVLALAHNFSDACPQWTLPHRPELSKEVGSCWAVCRVSGELRSLRPAVVLPLRWHANVDHSTWLPSKFRNLADQIVRQCCDARLLSDDQRWGLQPASDIHDQRNRLSEDCVESADSAWASLAAGLILAIRGLHPKTEAWASAGWSQHGVEQVEGLEQKIATAGDWGAESFFVPPGQKAEADDIVERLKDPDADHTGTTPQIHQLAMPVPPDLLVSLREFLAMMSDEPPPPQSLEDNEGFELCRQYYMTQTRQTVGSFYDTHLFPTVLHRLREMIAQNKDFSATHLISVVSPSTELTIYAAVSTGVENCLLLHTDQLADKAAEIKSQLYSQYGFDEDHIQLFDLGDFATTDVVAATKAYVRDHPEAKFVVNGKSGATKMVIELVFSVPKGSWVFNVNARMLSDRRNDPGEVSAEVYRLPSSA